MGMDPVTAMIGSAVIGGATSAYGANKAAKEQSKANRLNRETYEMYKPYVQGSLSDAQSYLDSVIGQGAYTGQTLAGTNPFQTLGNQFIGGAGAGLGAGALNLAQSGMGFGQNYQDLYNQAGEDRLQTAMDFATNNSAPLVQSAMRNEYRNLTENTLPQMNRAASGSGNINSSRAGVAEALANRAFDDRSADVTANINQQLMNQSLDAQNRQFADQMAANRGLSGAFSTGVNAIGTAGDFMTGAGRNLRGFDQEMLNDLRRRYEDSRDFNLNQQYRFNNQMLANAPQSQSVGYQPNYNSPFAAGLGGMMQGAGYGMDLANLYGQYQQQFGGGMPTNTDYNFYNMPGQSAYQMPGMLSYTPPPVPVG